MKTIPFLLYLTTLNELFISCESFSLLPKSTSTSITASTTLQRATLSNDDNDSNSSDFKRTRSQLFSKDDIAAATATANTNNKSILNRRDAILSTTTAASSFIFLQPSSAHAAEGDNSEENTSSTASTSSATNSIQLNSSSCSSTPSTSKPFPLASFGLQIYDNDKAYKLTLTALEAGYRNFFASVLAGNQKGFAKAIKDSNIPLSELYICGTVLSNRSNGYKASYDKTYKGCEENLYIMNTFGNINKLDMIMLDYPGGDEQSIKGQWDAFQTFQRNNLVDDLAVSNFNGKQLDCILLNNDNLCSVPTVNQLPLSIANHPKRYMEENTSRGNIHVQSWSPLSTTLPKYNDILDKIGQKYGKSAAQVGLRWIVQSNASYCVQSQKESHFKEDLDVFDFQLTDGDMEKLNSLEPPRLLG